jgi:hypothetical protein
LADIFVPSIRYHPDRRQPSRAQSPSMRETISSSARSWRQRNSAIVE